MNVIYNQFSKVLLFVFIPTLHSIEKASDLFTLDTSNPRSDSDNDTLLDDWETANGLDLNSDDTRGDPDGDGLTNLEEYNAGTNPQVADVPSASLAVSSPFVVSIKEPFVDSDNDHLPDDWENQYGLDPSLADSGEDPDGDGITNLEEYNGGWNPKVPNQPSLAVGESAPFTGNTGASPGGYETDTDKDGMPDWWEAKYGLNPAVNDADDNLDGDNLNNIEEYLSGRNPSQDDQKGEHSLPSGLFALDTIGLKADTDKDGMPDDWETAMGLDPTVANAEGDPDQDGLSNIQEYNAGSHPKQNESFGKNIFQSPLYLLDTDAYPAGFEIDTDQDGMPDWWEAKYGLSTIVPDGELDPDGDSLTNLQEYLLGGNPRKDFDFMIVTNKEGNLLILDTGGRFSDLDGDGIPNWWERKFAFDEHSLFPSEDLDGDGLTNLQEYIIGLDPLRSGSLFQIEATNPLHPTEKKIVLQWETVPGRRYLVFATDNLKTPWPTQPVLEITGDGTQKSAELEIGDARQRFYRVSVEVIIP